MLNLILAASYTHRFDLSTPLGIELVVALSLLGALLIGGAVIYFVKKDFFKTYLKAAFAVALAFTVSIVIANICMQAKDGEFKIGNVDCRPYLENVDFMAVAIVGTILLAIVLIATPFIADKKSTFFGSQDRTKAIAYAGICIALSFGLSYLKLFKAPYGGSITLASFLPLAVYSYLYGSKNGLIAGFVYSFLQFIQEPYFYHVVQFLLDYTLAFSFIGMCGGLFRNKLKPIFALPLGLAVGLVGRFLSHFISGAVFFGVWMPEGFSNIWTYSLVYNITYVIPDGIIAVVAAFALLSSKQVQAQFAKITQVQNKQDLIANS